MHALPCSSEQKGMQERRREVVQKYLLYTTDEYCESENSTIQRRTK